MEAMIVIVSVLLFLLLVGVPISFAMMAAGIAGLWMQRGWDGMMFLLGGSPYSTTAALALIVVPLFLFMGHMAFSAGLSDRAFEVARKWLGHITGGLGVATIASCASFATVSGSSIATAATVAKISIPQMLRYGYSPRLAGACSATGGTLGVLIPPSGILVVYSFVTNTSIPALFAAALIPGLLTALIYAALVYGLVVADPKMKQATKMAKPPLRERVVSLAKIWEVAILFGVVMGGMFFGIVTATEAAALGAGLALIFALTRGSGSRRSIVWKGLVSTGSTTSAIFLLLIGAALFGTAMSTTQVPQQLAMWLATLDVSKPVLTLLLLLPFLVLGCFIDGLSMITILMPILTPVLIRLGIDPIFFGILVVKAIEIGAITPPVGLNVFVVKSAVPEIKTSDVFRGVIPFIFAEILIVLLLISFPNLVVMPASILPF